MNTYKVDDTTPTQYSLHLIGLVKPTATMNSVCTRCALRLQRTATHSADSSSAARRAFTSSAGRRKHRTSHIAISIYLYILIKPLDFTKRIG